MDNFHSRPYYDKWIKLASPEIRFFLSEENKFVKKSLFGGCSVLDVGCGYGRTIKAIHKLPLKITAIDNSKRMVKNAKLNLKGIKNVKVLCMDAFNLEFKKQKFDFILCLANTFGNFSSRKLKAIKEMKKVLKKGGKIIIHVYNKKSLKYRVKDYEKARMPVIKIEKDGTVHSAHGLTLEQFTKKKLRNLFSKAKLKLQIKQLTPISYMCIAER